MLDVLPFLHSKCVIPPPQQVPPRETNNPRAVALRIDLNFVTHTAYSSVRYRAEYPIHVAAENLFVLPAAVPLAPHHPRLISDSPAENRRPPLPLRRCFWFCLPALILGAV